MSSLLQNKFGKWFIFWCCSYSLTLFTFISGVPQGSILGPLLFILHTANLFHVIECHGLEGISYADDIQVRHGSCKCSDTAILWSSMVRCIEDIGSLTSANRLNLNQKETELIWSATNGMQHHLDTTSLHVSGVSIERLKSVQLLGSQMTLISQ